MRNCPSLIPKTLIYIILSATSVQQLKIENSASFNYYSDSFTSDKAYDGNYYTFYSPKDREVAGNFLKLYLSQAFSITEVKMTSRPDRFFVERILNTEVKIYSAPTGDKGAEIDMASCGKITGKIISFKQPILTEV